MKLTLKVHRATPLAWLASMREGRPLCTQARKRRMSPYVASLSDYNAGRMHGCFIDDCTDPDAIHDAIQAMLRESPEAIAEEWAIHDYEGFGPIHLHEYESLTTVVRLARGITELGPAFAAWAAYIGSAQWDDDLDQFEDAYLGHYDSARDYAEELIDSFGLDDWRDAVPEVLRNFVRIVIDGFAGDLTDSYIFLDAPDHGVYVFVAL